MTYSENLSDRVAVVTGASSGIGAATARHLRALGMRLVVTARREERLRELAAEGGAVEVLAGDVLDPALPQRLIERAVSVFGRCDAVFNNAAAFAVGPVEKLDADRVCALARVNVEAAYRVAFEAVKYFKSAGGGDLVNMSSISGAKVPRAGIGWYAGTKHALEALTESLRMECAGTGVRVSCVEPGMTQTEIFGEPITSIARALDPEDVAHVVGFILSAPPHVTIPRVMVLPSSQAI